MKSFSASFPNIRNEVKYSVRVYFVFIHFLRLIVWPFWSLGDKEHILTTSFSSIGKLFDPTQTSVQLRKTVIMNCHVTCLLSLSPVYIYKCQITHTRNVLWPTCIMSNNIYLFTASWKAATAFFKTWSLILIEFKEKKNYGNKGGNGKHVTVKEPTKKCWKESCLWCDGQRLRIASVRSCQCRYKPRLMSTVHSAKTRLVLVLVRLTSIQLRDRRLVGW